MAENKIKTGTNGKPMGPGYKGNGMCANCLFREEKVPNSNNYLCGYYMSTCRQVSRNCTGIKSFKST